MKKIIVVIILAASILVGCGGGHPVAYRPTAFGENNQCYYVNSPAETVALQAQGLCQRNWAPTLMPMYWHQRYWNYYSSPVYYNAYVPANSRSSYAASERTWGAGNRGAIAAASKGATYQGSNGKVVTSEKIGAAKYGGGARFGPSGTKFGGGSARTGGISSTPTPKAPSAPSAPSKAPSSPSSPGKSFGGGSGRPSSGGGSHSYGGGSHSYGGGSHSYGGGSHSFGGGHR